MSTPNYRYKLNRDVTYIDLDFLTGTLVAIAPKATWQKEFLSLDSRLLEAGYVPVFILGDSSNKCRLLNIMDLEELSPKSGLESAIDDLWGKVYLERLKHEKRLSPSSNKKRGRRAPVEDSTDGTGP